MTHDELEDSDGASTMAVIWEKWAAVHHLKLWEAVALSLDMEPLTVPFERGDEFPFVDAPEAFRQRLNACISGMQSGVLDCVTYTMDGQVWKNLVGLADFGAFARRIGWSLPHRFPQVFSCADAEPESALKAEESPAERAARVFAAVEAAKATHPRTYIQHVAGLEHVSKTTIYKLLARHTKNMQPAAGAWPFGQTRGANKK